MLPLAAGINVATIVCILSLSLSEALAFLPEIRQLGRGG